LLDYREIWRLLDVEFEDPYMNMAVEEAVARQVGEGESPSTLRFWRNSNAVVIGAYQDPRAEVNFDSFMKHGTILVRRFTGGGAVYHDKGNMNLAISVPTSHRLVKDDILVTFRDLSLGLLEGLKYLGVKNAKWDDGNCVSIDGLKISGFAGAIKWNTFFYHGSILLASDTNRLQEILRSQENANEKHVRSVRRAVTTLRKETDKMVSMTDLKRAVKRGFEDALGIALKDETLSSKEHHLARELYDEKYSTSKWNYEGCFADSFRK
jgi:lipoyltransferase/lipoate-protein ligase